MARHRGRALTGVDIHVITAPALRLDREPHRHRLLETARQLRPRLVLLDPLVRLHRVDENNASEVAELLAYFRSLQRQLDLSVILVHHTRKNAAGGVAAGQGLRGSSDLHAFGDSNLYLRRVRERLMLLSEHRAAPAAPAVTLELVTTDAATTHLEVVASPPSDRRATCRSKSLLGWWRGKPGLALNCATCCRSRTNAWARPWRRWNGPVRFAAHPMAGNVWADHEEGRSAFPIEIVGTERSSPVSLPDQTRIL
jgi:hypothetical protein